MKCVFHVESEAAQQCLACDRALCTVCAHMIKGSVYCQECLVHGAEWAAAVRHLKGPKDVAKRAALLAIIPGMGAVYNNQYFKALVMLVIFLSLCVAGEINPAFVFGAISFYAFMIMDSYRTAEDLQRQRVEREGPISHRTVDMSSPAWGGVLIALGLLLTLSNYVIITDQVRKLWPVVIILLGVFMVYRSLSQPRTDV